MTVTEIGILTRDFILEMASYLVRPEVPGLISLALGAALLLLIILTAAVCRQQSATIGRLKQLVEWSENPTFFSQRYASLSEDIRSWHGRTDRRLAHAWAEFRETVIEPSADRNGIIENSVRPSEFFNLENLRFGLAGWRFWSGLFVSIGLFFTFLGLVSALRQTGVMLRTAGDGANSAVMTGALTQLLDIASAKFIMSLTGLLASIIFAVWVRYLDGGLKKRIAKLADLIESRVQFVSLESLAQRQLEEARSLRSHTQKLNTELIAALSEPLRAAASQGSDAAGETLRSVAGQIAETLSGSIERAGAQMEIASDKMAELTVRMSDFSNGFVSGMERTTAGLDAVARRLEMVSNELAAAGEGLARGATPLAKTIAGTTETARTIAKASIDLVDAAKTSLSEQSAALLSTAKIIQEQVAAFEVRSAAYDGEMERAFRSYKENLDVAIGEVERHSESVHGRYADALQRLQSVIDNANTFEPEHSKTIAQAEA